ncbi:MAG: putative serine protease PepD [Actinomycetota bacterium]|jgi:putative serine protease PepD|nr:putative serine protease PepD [Actinomycetota bacterium]
MTTTDVHEPWYAEPPTTPDWSRPEFALPPPPVVPPPAPPVQPEPTSPLSRPRRLALLVAALVLAGAAGGGIVARFDRPAALTTTAIGASVARSTSAVAASTATAGTPEAAAAVIGPSVVTVEVSGTDVVTSPFGQRSQQVSDTGSGIVVRVDGSTGYILTNNHVVSAALAGGSVHITLNDGRTVAGTIVGHDTTSDLAAVKVTGVTGLTAAVFADSDALKVGQAVLAIGAPLGLSNTVTQGIVSTLHRPVATGESGAGAQAVLDAVQTDAAINPGNSGGALVDLAGRVVGINSAIASTGSSSQSGNIGVGFAIPSNDAAAVADQLIATGHATHAQIGISAQDAASSTDGAPGLGAAIGQVTAGGPAAKAGLQQGDLITRIGNRVVTDADSLIVAVRANAPGMTVTVTYQRGGRSHTAAVTLGAAGSS